MANWGTIRPGPTKPVVQSAKQPIAGALDLGSACRLPSPAFPSTSSPIVYYRQPVLLYLSAPEWSP